MSDYKSDWKPQKHEQYLGEHLVEQETKHHREAEHYKDKNQNKNGIKIKRVEPCEITAVIRDILHIVGEALVAVILPPDEMQ